MAGHSSKAVYAAISANTLVMVAKFGAFLATGSAAMLSEAIHSLADVGNQALLALGMVKSRQGPSEDYPFGMRRDRFVWALISAVGVFFLGCGVTVYHGVHSLLHPQAFEGSPWVLGGVLLFSAVVEGSSLWFAWRELDAARGERGLLDFVTHSDDPLGAAVLFEDSAAVIGVGVAGAGIALTWLTGDPMWDALASILIGLMLGLVAVFLVRRNRELLLGEAPDPAVLARLEALLEGQPEIEEVRRLKAVVMGAGALRLHAEVDFDGRALASDVLASRDLDAEVARLADGDALGRWAQDFGDELLERLGDTVDRIEAEAEAAVPQLAHVDIEAD